MSTNLQLPVGTDVIAYPGLRPEDNAEATAIYTSTRSLPWLLGGHTPVVMVDGYPGGIALTHIDERPSDENK